MLFDLCECVSMSHRPTDGEVRRDPPGAIVQDGVRGAGRGGAGRGQPRDGGGEG